MTFAVMAENHDRAEIFPSIDDAVGYLDSMRDPELRVFRVEQVSESALWDWSTRKAGSDEQPNFSYTSERVARSCCREGDELVKRRCGTSTWVLGYAA